MKHLVAAAILSAATLSALNIDSNPGFESGLSLWTVSGGAGSNWAAGAGAHSGSGAVSDGCSGSGCISTPTSILYQDLTTAVGSTYIVSFWASSGTTSTPTELQALLGGTIVKDLVNFANGYNLYTSSTFTATSTTTRLQFNGRDDPAFMQLDDVCVDVSGGACGGTVTGSTPEPSTWFTSGAGAAVLLAIGGLRRKKT
jgi:hypothetical protein